MEPSEKSVLGLVEKTPVPRSKPTCLSGLAAAAMAQQQRQPWQQGQALWWAALAPASAAAACACSAMRLPAAAAAAEAVAAAVAVAATAKHREEYILS